MLKVSSFTSYFRKNPVRNFVTDPVLATPKAAQTGVDIFQKAKTTAENNYLSDVVFEKTGFIFKKIKATFQGKPIATTKSELGKQIHQTICDTTGLTNKKAILKAKNNVKFALSKLKKPDVSTIARISKFFHQLNTTDNQFIATILNKITTPGMLATIDKFLTHPRKLNLKEVSSAYLESCLVEPEQVEKVLNSSIEIIPNDSLANCFARIRNLYQPPLEKQIDRIKIKLEDVEDKKIKQFVLSEFEKPKQNQIELFPHYFISKDGKNDSDLEKLELLLDSYHAGSGHYSMINGKSHHYYKAISKSKKGKFLFNFPKAELEEIPSNSCKIFNEEIKIEPLKRFIAKYSRTEGEISDYIYTKFFLSRLPEEIASSYKDFRNKFGTYLFTETHSPINTNGDLYIEFDEWQKASNGKAKFPTIIDFSHIDEEFLIDSNLKETNAYINIFQSSLHIPHESFNSCYGRHYLRHEIAHLNDAFFDKKGIINGINSDEIIKQDMYSTELDKAGISYKQARYAYTNKNELIAVAATGDYRKYSDEFKDILIKLGMPEWIFKMEPLRRLLMF